ncbi:38259_t:CDS:2 [Gigaspora margarita]|uniref:38259_t:CDS:1 n=1 Tax=Gigaspora margarita TaxID=4874 RepID=A0ABN7ULD3_GIGMA|nr:38259_t:CDS:2 [Gigaspora margarita]
MVDLYIFQDLRVAKNTREAVQQYFVHMLNELSHQSKEFLKELVEHFGAFTGSNNEPYTTSNTALSHNKKHLKLAVNFNIISQFHQDVKDHYNSLCVVCLLGIFKSRQLVFPELKLIFMLKKNKQ